MLRDFSVSEDLNQKFAKIGARLVVRTPENARTQRRTPETPLRIDVRTDRDGEYFDIVVSNRARALQVLDLRPRERHLLLLARDVATGEKEKFLCGHDERHWFVAAIPPGSVSSVPMAIESLKPAEVVRATAKKRVHTKNRNRRRNPAFIRQGEWFFVPEPDAKVPSAIVLRDEPLRRGNGKPHMVEFLARQNGITVYVCPHYPQGLTESSYRELLDRRPKARNYSWRLMRRDADVLVKGRVRHADHQTVDLVGWHRVFMNRENEAPAMRHVAFLD